MGGGLFCSDRLDVAAICCYAVCTGAGVPADLGTSRRARDKPGLRRTNRVPAPMPLAEQARRRPQSPLLKGWKVEDLLGVRPRTLADINGGANARRRISKPGGVWPNPAPEGHATVHIQESGREIPEASSTSSCKILLNFCGDCCEGLGKIRNHTCIICNVYEFIKL
jgi:hypothetical protein